MNILVNGEPKTLPDQATLADLIIQMELTGKRIAVEVNAEIVPRSQHGETHLNENDQVEIVHAIGGG
ncbi:sulfur carrier protein ThiS [Oceanospirillum linum]|uniref:Sulfur carrier protein ThiS n=1 Tax=Oceanospirillum linum TaxID=966 RepID=A0A1T1HBT9_OCELI|nr:sulfur carrier protein ThiS [Oceanospirillum linum]OOV87309.1 sulfur carrier protein ThiS [Oceanospirillum linum]SEF80993.1 sulfur carrier protein ThiS [Oleiphilus messinensis]SMP18948.1 sulfur carrier protein ThiS [Oceanospirillum linum]